MPTSTAFPTFASKSFDFLDRVNRCRFIAAGVAAATIAPWPATRGTPKANAHVGCFEFVGASNGERLHREFVDALLAAMCDARRGAFVAGAAT